MTTPPPAAAPAEPSPPPASILVVDDTPNNRDLLRRRLEPLGHVVTAAEDGRQAMDKLRAGPFDLVLLDIMMPEMDGFAVLAAMKADPALRHVPVIVITALGLEDMDSVVRCIELGAEDYLPKPFKNVLLQARVGATLEKKRLRDRERQVLAQLQVEQAKLRAEQSKLEAEQAKTDRLLLSIFPPAIADRLKDHGGTPGEGLSPGESPASIADSFPDATVLIADISNFTELAASKSPTELVGLLNTVFTAFDRLCERHGVEKVKTIGDAYVAAAGVPAPHPADGCAAAADAALAMQAEVVRLNTGLPEPFSLRVGMDAGPVVAGVIGTTKFAYDVWGRPVDTAAQMEQYGLPGGIQVTAAVHRRLKDRYLFEERGAFYIEGAGEVETYLLKGKRPGAR